MRNAPFENISTLHDLHLFRTHSTNIRIQVGQNGSIHLDAHPHQLPHDLKDMLKLSVGPRDNYDGIKSCMTYNPPGRFKPGYQGERAVSLLDIHSD